MRRNRFDTAGARDWRILGVTAFILSAVIAPVRAAADEPRKASEPDVLSEPAEMVQVVDAFDDHDPFDVTFTLGFQQTIKGARIRREAFGSQPGLATGNYVSDDLDVAQVTERRSRINTRLDVGIYRDVGLFVRMPIILSDTRELDGLSGSGSQQGMILRGEPGEQLFRLPFLSPTRSGIEYLAVGVEFAPLNQTRRPHFPTWLVGLEGRLNVSEPMHACSATPSNLNQTMESNGAPLQQASCAHPSDYNRNGTSGDVSVEEGGQIFALEGNFGGTRDAGVSRGVNALHLYTTVSKRIKYIEPYTGFKALFEFPTAGSDFESTHLEGSRPPLRGTMVAGVAVIPWEMREQYQRVTFDARFEGTYVSEGRDYSELFDALGSSDAPSLRRPQYSEYEANPDEATSGESPSVVDPRSRRVHFTGITAVQGHVEWVLSGQATWQAGEYVKFHMGTSYAFVEPHLLTYDQECNPGFTADLGKSGPCHTSGIRGEGVSSTGIPNPNYRRTVNVPGYRFKVDDVNQFDGWINVSVMF